MNLAPGGCAEIRFRIRSAYCCGGYWQPTGVIPREALRETLFAGELGLDGRINKIRGILGMVMEARKAGCKTCILPEENAAEGRHDRGQ